MNLIKIPRNIFQTWEIKDLTPEMNLLTSSWKINNPNFVYFLFDDTDRKNFIKKHFDEKIYNAYCKIIPGAFKADLWRYCILYIYGGVFVDLDTLCLNNIDIFLDENIEFMTAVDLNNCPTIGKYNLTNGFMASVPKHKILLNCIDRIVYNIENNIIPSSNLDFSGPGVLGKSLNLYLNLNEETSFLGKEGIINKTIKLLKFEYGSENILDIETRKILFQNKNGNKLIQDIYNNEIKRINHIDWGNCKNPFKTQNPTIVTMLYNIREKEGNNDINNPLNRGLQKYCKLASEFLLKLDYNLIIFTDSDEVIKYIEDERKDRYIIINERFENTYYYKHLDILTELQRKFTILNGNVKQETPMYIILNNNKFYFMEKAIELNPFNSNHFVWMDIGINHVAKNPEKIEEWFFLIPDKIKQLCINPYIENIDNKIMFQNIYHHMAGGLFSGSKDNLLKYCNLFKAKTEQIYSEDWYQIDEAVMTMIQRENPDLFDLYYGDYQGIISNYISPIHNIDLILRGSQKCIDSNKTKMAFDILCYCNNYFIQNKNDPNILYFIQQHIIVDYYNNNKKLLTYIVDLINYLIYVKNTDITIFLKCNQNNLDFYENKNLLNI
jgi:hypothetical protein